MPRIDQLFARDRSGDERQCGQLLDCLGRLRRLVEARDWHSDDAPLPDWLRPQQDQSDREADQVVATDKRPRAANC
ncbi:MAG: hypothetical protein V2I51_05280 [Anderseniella sp.]|nr:hypothetical protein [Anderseniella sp.]